MINRRLLYTGAFLVAMGAVLLLARSDALAGDTVAGALRFWPVVVIGLGAGLLLRGTRLGIAGGVLAAALPGLLIGGLVVAAPDMTPECRLADPASYSTRQGTFEEAATVDLQIDCGHLSVTTGSGTGWQVRTGDTKAAAPVVDVSAGRLSVRSSERRDHVGLPWGGDALDVTLPTGSTLDLSAAVNAGRGRFDLTGARLGDVELDVNAGELRVDLTGASLERLTMDVNAAKAAVVLPRGGDFSAQFHVNAAELELCAPAGLGLRITGDAVLGSTTYSGLVRDGDAWETPGYSMATGHANVTMSVNVGSVNVNPEGGCK